MNWYYMLAVLLGFLLDRTLIAYRRQGVLEERRKNTETIARLQRENDTLHRQINIRQVPQSLPLCDARTLSGQLDLNKDVPEFKDRLRSQGSAVVYIQKAGGCA